MVKLAKRIKAVVCASILVASTAIASLVPATQVKAAAPTGCSISIVAQDEYNAGETVKITTSFTGATKVTYEFYSQSFNPYYGYVPSTKKFSVEKALPGTPAIASGTDVIIDIPSNARGTYTVKAVFEDANGDKTTVKAATKLSVKNSSYDKSMAYYYYLNGNSGSTISSTVPSWYYYYLLNDGEDDNNALLYYYMSNNGGSISDPYLYYLLTDDEDDNKALLYYYYMNNNSTSSTMPSWYYYYLLNDDEDDNKALLYYYYMNNSNISSTDPMWYYLFR